MKKFTLCSIFLNNFECLNNLHRALALMVSRVSEQLIAGPRPYDLTLGSLLEDGGSPNSL